jgi:hypothetical protein
MRTVSRTARTPDNVSIRFSVLSLKSRLSDLPQRRQSGRPQERLIICRSLVASWCKPFIIGPLSKGRHTPEMLDSQGCGSGSEQSTREGRESCYRSLLPESAQNRNASRYRNHTCVIRYGTAPHHPATDKSTDRGSDYDAHPRASDNRARHTENRFHRAHAAHCSRRT